MIVAEGFSGNIALKAAEGTARQINEFLREALSTPLAFQARLPAGETGVQGAA